MQVACVTVDCASPRALVQFWAHALGWDITHAGDDGAYCQPTEGGIGLEFMRVDEPKGVKNRVHLGIRTDELDREVARLVELGATVAWEEDLPDGWPYRNIVLRDPEGNEFCIGDEPPR